MSKPLTRAELVESTALVPLVWKARAFDSSSIYRDARPHGESIEEMVRSLPNLPDRFWAHGVVCINGDEVNRDLWRVVRPKAPSLDRPVIVTMHMPLAGGRGGAAKSIIGIIAALALTVLTAGIASGVLLGATSAAIGGAFGLSATAGASILAGAVGIVGSLAISALTAPPAVKQADEQSASADNKESAAVAGNTIDPGGAIPRVIGTRKAFPVFACEPVVELVDGDEIVEAIYILNGPHKLEDIRIGEGLIADAEDIEFITREGWPDDTLQDLVLRQGRTSQPNLELSTHRTDSESQARLKHPSSPDDDIPVWHTVASRNSPDEIWLHFSMPQGLSQEASPSNGTGLPVRVRLRRRGDLTWINLPELHITDNTTAQRRHSIVFKFAPAPGAPVLIPSTTRGFAVAFGVVPDQTAAPGFTGWTADSYFLAASGPTYMDRTNYTTTRLRNIELSPERVVFTLDPTIFIPGIYEIQVKRGSTYDRSSFTDSTYVYGGVVKSFFEYVTSGGISSIPRSRENLTEILVLARVISIWNEQPIPQPGFATIAIRATNRRVESLSAKASGYVKDWDGTGWNTWTTTSNPAPHYVDILSGSLNIDPLPSDLRDDTGLVAWRTLCTANDWTCDTIIDDSRTQDALQLLASCGYARPYQSEIYGVTVDRDVSADAPIQVFSPRNSSGFRWERSFAKLPDGFVVGYKDSAVDYADTQTVVYRTGYEGGDSGLLESTNFDGLVDTAKVEARARFDLDQAEQRATFYYLDVDAEALLCRRGDLVAVQHDILAERTGSARIRRKILSGSNIIGLELDSEIEVQTTIDLHAVANVHTVADLHQLGLKTALTIRHTDGTLSTHVLTNPTGTTKIVTFSVAISNTSTIEGLADTGDESGCLIVSGDLGSEYLRLLVFSIAPGPYFTFSLTLVDEAPALVRG